MFIRKDVIGTLILLLAVGAAPTYANDDQLVEELMVRLADLEDRLAAYEAQEPTVVENLQVAEGGAVM